MGQVAAKNRGAAVDCLAWAPAQLERHEFVDGDVFAMASAEVRHVTIAGNLYTALRQPVPPLHE